jgi:hypothetical protein
VVANFGFDQLHENIVPPLTLLLARALHESRPIRRLYEDGVDMACDLFSISYLDNVRHVDAGLRYRLGLRTKKKNKKSRLRTQKKSQAGSISEYLHDRRPST